MRRRVRAGGRERGAAMVEFALVFVPLLVLLLGFIDFSLAYNAQQAVTASAREGVRALALGNTDQVEPRAVAAAEPLDAADLTVTITQACVPGAPGRVRVTYLYEFLTPLPALVGFGDSIVLTGKGEMRCGG